MRRLDFSEIARADLKSIRRYSQRAWGLERTVQYMAALRDTIKGLVVGTVVSRKRDDLRPGLHMATSGRHCVFFEADHLRNSYRSRAARSDGILASPGDRGKHRQVTESRRRATSSSVGPVGRDPIVDELHRVREEIGKAHDFDVLRIAAAIRQHEEENPEGIVRQSPKRTTRQKKAS